MSNLPETETQESARDVVERAQREIGIALARIDLALGTLMNVRRAGPVIAALVEAGSFVMVAEAEARRLLERGPQFYADLVEVSRG
jgi:hypothetical protein